MADITRSNFEERFPEIENNLRKSLFIALDNEFTGILSDPEYKPSLFDTGSERYVKLRQSLEHFLVLQVGITTFNHSEEENKYLANRYTFHVFPRSFASIDNKFMCQASSFEFLCQHNFDFNKFVYQGISYFNLQQEAYLRKALSEGLLFRNLERTISIEDEKFVQSICSRVAEWAASAVLGDVLQVEELDVRHEDKRLMYIIHKELRQRFSNVWTYSDKGRIQVKKLSQLEWTTLKENEDKSLEKDMMDSLLGFSRVFKLLVELQKPVIGHNLLLDLMMMYNQFHEQLPPQFDVFKKKIRKLFPIIYDTKFLSFELRKILKKEDMWDSNVLSNLYHFFKEGRGRYTVLYSPIIELQNGSNIQDPQIKGQKSSADIPDNCEQSSELDVKFHEAGWDSFCTGYCFIRMAHIFAHTTLGSIVEGRARTSRDHLLGVASKKNCLNIIRASVAYVYLDGSDPVSQRPRWIHVQRRGFRSIDISQVAELFARFGAVDVKPFTKHGALVAVGNHGSARDILRQFNKHKEFKVCYYHPFHHSPIVKAFMWGGLFISGGICTYLLYKELKVSHTGPVS